MAGEPLRKSISPESPGFSEVVEELRRHLGATCVGRWATLCSHLDERLLELQLATPTQYAKLLRERHPVELAATLGLMTNGETYFLRQPQQLEFLTQHVFPRVAKAFPLRPMLMWSSGCSTGEEVYTLAALAVESGLFSDGMVRVIGSDVASERLELARDACFANHSFRAANAEFRTRHFLETPRGAVARQQLRDMCEFHQLNLLDEAAMSALPEMQIAFCRNLFIYMEPDARRRAEANLVSRLAPGGWLFVGPGEQLLEPRKLAARGVDTYQRVDTEWLP